MCLNKFYLGLIFVCLNGFTESGVPAIISGKNHNSSSYTRIFIKCETHLNCSKRFLTLESYCCESAGFNMSCCNWLEYISTFNRSTSNLPYKNPTLLTIIALLLLFIFISCILYCLLMSCCYCFRIGLFKRPKIVIIRDDESSSATNSRGGAVSGSDSVSADMVVVATPKSSSSVSSPVSSEAEEVSYSNRNRSRNRSSSAHRRPHQQHYDQRVIKPNQRRKKPTSCSSAASHNNNYNRNRSPKARVFSAGATSSSSTRPHNRSSHNSNRAGHHRLYADPNCYIDLENESPFLVPHSNRDDSRPRNSSSGRQQRAAAASSRPAQAANAFMVINDEITRAPNRQQPTVTRSSSLSSVSSSSLNLNLVNAPSSMSVNNAQNPANNGLTHAPSYYFDEKPPSYDDIIKNPANRPKIN